MSSSAYQLSTSNSNSGHLTRLPFSPYDDVMNPSAPNGGPGKPMPPTQNSPYTPGMFPPTSQPMRPPGPPGQWAPPPMRPPLGANGYGAPPLPPTSLNQGVPRPPMSTPNSFGQQPPNMRPPGQMPPQPMSQPFMNGPNGPVNTNSNNPPLRPPFQGQLPPTNGGAPPQNFGSHVNSALPPFSNANSIQPNGAYEGAPSLSRPNELPAPFHGQGQYSHQVNPFLLNTPANSEPSSEKTSRQPSPVTGGSIDALEGQFTPSKGLTPTHPGFPGARNSPVSKNAVGNFPPAQGQQNIVRPLAGAPPPHGFPTQGQHPPPPQQFPPPPGGQFPPTSNGQFPPRPQQFPQQPSPPTAQGFPPTSGVPQRFPPPPSMPGDLPPSTMPGATPLSGSRFPPPSSASMPGFAPPSTSMPGFAPPPPSSMPGFAPPPPSSMAGFAPPSTGMPGFAPPSTGMPGFAPPPPSASSVLGYPPQPGQSQRYPPPPGPAGPRGYPTAPGTGPLPPTPGMAMPPTPQPGSVPPQSNQFGAGAAPQYPGPPQPGQFGQPQPGHFNQPQPGQYSQPTQQPGPYNPPQQPSQYGQPNTNSVNAMTQNFGQMGIQNSQRAVNLMNERQLVLPEGVETARPTLPHDFKKVNCSPDVFRCTLNAIPQTSALLSKARLPLGILIHPFRDLSQLPVIQSTVIVRCRSCRTYINPFVTFVDSRRWKCNLCFRVNDLPDEFSFDPVSKTYGDPQRRPEVRSATIEFIAPSEYMLRPPQPAVYLFLLDVSFNAVETGYLSQFCGVLSEELDKLPGDARTSVGFLCYDKSLYYFNLAEGLSQPQMLCVPDIEEPFLPTPDNLVVNLQESKDLILELLAQLPQMFDGNMETGSCLGAALLSAQKMMSATGGRVTVMQTCLPTVGPGALENRDAANTSGKNVTNLGPATDFYKKLSLDCSSLQIAVDLFMLNGQYADIATLSCMSKYSGGSVYHFPSFHTVRTPSLVDKFDADLRRYLTRKVGFESVMRIRCTRGLSIHTFHGNFFVRSTDLLSLPNVNPDAGFAMQMSIEDTLNESPTVSFQAALLYTSSKGERRIRVHTLCIPVTNQISEVFAQADQQAVASLLAKMAVDRSINSAISDARDAMINAPVDTLAAYATQIPASQRVGALVAPHSLRLLPMYMLAMLKSTAFSLSTSIKIDDRVFAMQQMKAQPLCYLLQSLYPDLYPLHMLSMENPIKRGEEEIPSAPKLQLSSANIDRTGLFLMDAGESMYMLVGSGVGDQVCQDVFDKPNFMSLPEDMIDLPELENEQSEMVRSFVNHLMDTRPNGITFLVIRDDSKHRHQFFQHMLEDRTENSMSYYEFLQFLQGKMKG